MHTRQGGPSLGRVDVPSKSWRCVAFIIEALGLYEDAGFLFELVFSIPIRARRNRSVARGQRTRFVIICRRYGVVAVSDGGWIVGAASPEPVKQRLARRAHLWLWSCLPRS